MPSYTLQKYSEITYLPKKIIVFEKQSNIYIELN